MKRFAYAAVAMACVLTACGGGGGNTETNKTTVTSVKVAGASLADSGTFGYRFTVQGATYPVVYTERIAATFGASTLCNVYAYASSTFSANTSQTGCTNYAVAGASLGNYSLTYHTYLSSASPTSMLAQLTAMGTAAGSTGFTSNDLIVVGEGPANDVATLATAFLYYNTYVNTSGASGSTYDLTQLMTTSTGLTILGLDSTTVNTMLTTSATTRGQLAGLYMKNLASLLASSIQTNLLAKGASKVVVLNVLDVTLTPKFKGVLAQLNALDTTGATATAFQSAVQQWIQAFNTQLNTSITALNTDKVAIVDFYTGFTAEMGNPSQYLLTNVSASVCDEIVSASTSTTTTVATAASTSLSTTVSGVPTVAAACTTTATSADALLTKFGASAWWQTYLFADNFHPTPYGHKLLAQLVTDRLAKAGWL